jgi:[ribosomal protein S18]-alanine N-acetyltransferase
MPRLSLSEARSLARDFEAIQNFGLRPDSLVSLWTCDEIEGELNSPFGLQFVHALGFILYRLEGSAAVQVMHLAVKNKGQGDFAKLWADFEPHLKAQNIAEVFLEAKESSSAEKAYAACGFSRQALRKNYYKDGANAWVMTKRLSL